VKSNKARREALTLQVILVTVGLVTGLIITTYRGNISSGQEGTILGAQAAYPATPDPEARQAAAALLTQNAIEKTQSAQLLASDVYAKTIYLEGTLIPTGTDTAFTVLNTSRYYLYIDPKNMWFGLVNGHTARVDAGASLEDPSQGVIHLMMGLPNGCQPPLLRPPIHPNHHPSLTRRPRPPISIPCVIRHLKRLFLRPIPKNPL
jgi:hypothetical protein